MGVCSDAVDVSGSLSTALLPSRDWTLLGLSSKKVWSAALPGGYNLTIPTLYAFDVFPPRSSTQSMSFQHLGSQVFADLYLIYSNLVDSKDPDSEVQFGAVEMVWYWCPKAYAVKVTGGKAISERDFAIDQGSQPHRPLKQSDG